MDNTLRRFCKLYTFVLLLLIVEATDSNNNGITQDNRKSRVTGRIVKLYSGTRPEPILCVGEGFQADPRDCAVFYRCMKSGNGKFTVFRFQCGPGTVYDPETEVCNHPRSTRRTECGGLLPAPPVDRLNNNEIEGAHNEIPSPITNIPTLLQSTTVAKPTSTIRNTWTPSSSTMSTSTKRQVSEVPSLFTNLYPWESTVGHTTMDYTRNPTLLLSITTQKPSYTEASKNISPSIPAAESHSNSQDNICISDGFMGDSENCRKFYRCVANQRGTYTRFEFSCSESTVWDDDTQSCNHAWAVKRSRCGRSNQNNHVAINTKVPQTDRTTDKTIQQQLQISYGSKVTQTQTQISNGSVIQNQTQINFGDRLNQNKDTKAEQNQTQISYGAAISQTQTQIDYSDKAVQTQLQIDHSQQSSQSQTQIHGPTTNGPSRSTQSSSNNVGNTCETSGFMGDANDCKKFYRCVDNGRGGYTKFEFSCGEGTVWDQTIEACNHAWAVKECGGKGTSGTTSTTQASASTSQSTQNYHTTASAPPHTTQEIVTQDYEDSGYGQQNQNPTSSSSTTLSSTSPSTTSTSVKPSSNGDCQFSGFIGDPNDCKVFYRCVENGKGSFTKYEFKCGEGTVWDPDLEACNHAWAVKRCGGSASPDVSQTETTTEKQNIQSTTSTISSAVTQSSSELPATQNDDYDTGYGQNNNDLTTSSTSTTTTTKQPQNTDNTGNICQFSGFMGDHNDCKKFYRCVDNGNGGFTRYEFTCGEGTVWDPKIEACNHAWAVENCGGSAGGHQEATTQTKPTTINEVVASSTTQSDQSTVSSTPLPSSTISSSTSAGSVLVASTDCKNSGFMGDQNDCKKFYRCVDNGKGSYIKYEFSCGEGTVWDQKIEACNHAWAVEKCGGSGGSSSSHQETSTQLHPTMSDEIENGYPSIIDTDSDTTTQSATTHSTTEGSKVPSNSNNCLSSGFMGDKNNCKKFYRCVDNGNGGYTRYEFDCGEGTLWDQSIEACNHASAVKDCGATSNNTVQEPVESSTQISSTTETGEVGYPQSTEKTSTSTTHTYPESETSEICSKEGFVGDKNNCKKFYRCVDNGRGGYTKYEFTCGDGTYWNQEILSCDHATSDKTCVGTESSSGTQTHQPEHDEIYTESSSIPSSTTTERNEIQTQKPQVSSDVCESEGFYGDRNDCKKFYRCVDNGKGGYTKYDFTCGEGTVWDQEIQACNHESSNKNCSYATVPAISSSTTDQPALVTDNSMTTASQTQHTTETTQTSSSPSSSPQCSSEGFFAVPNDCKKFIRCVSNDKGGYTKYEFSCGDGTVWVQDILACDHDTGDTNCSSQTTSRPVTTEGNQQTTENNEMSSSTTETQTIDKQEDEYDNTNSEKPSSPSSGQCTSEGFYGNENDCRQFYRCVDNGQGGYTKYDFTCGEGTAWDSDIQTCNHIDQVKSCQGGSPSKPVMHDEDNSPTEASSTSSSSTTAGSTSSSATTSSSTSSSTTPSSEADHTTSANKDKCDSEGYFGNSEDCKKFYRCVDNGKGSYTKYDFTCGEGTIWDQDITTCNHPQDVVNPSCNQQQDTSSSSSTEASSSSSSSSSGTTSTTSPSSTQSTTESSQNSSNCTQENSSKKPQNQNITCDKAGYYANPNDCKKFYRCVDWDGDGKRFSVYHFECGEGTIWDPAVETCNHEESVYPPRDCSGSESQSANPPPATEGTTTTQQDTTSSQESTSTQSTSTSQSSTEQTTQSSTTESTTKEQSTTSEQTTTQQSSTSEQTTSSQTSSQATTEQTTQQSSTTEQTTEQTTQSTSSSQTTTEQSTTSEQTTTQQSTTSEQTTTQQSTTSEQTTQESTTSEQTTQSSTTTEQSQQSTTEQSTTSEGTTEQTTTEQLITEHTSTEQSTTDQSTTQQSTTDQSTTEQSTTEQSTTEQSTTEQSTTEQSTTEQSTTEQSTTEQSTTEQSTTEQSTTEQSTTEQSTTEQSTTEQSTTEQSTTEQSTTEQSTTEQSTTEQSTTEQSNNNSTTESKCPETNEDQSLFVCPTSFRRHPKYCNLFYQCDEDDDTHDVKIAVFTCPNNTIYDESQTRCVEESKADKKCDGEIAQKRRFKRLDKNYKEPIVVTKESQACPGVGYFSFEKDSECSPAFLKCKKDKRNVLRGLVYRCPRGYVYWSISKRCEPDDNVRDCKRSQNNWSGRWEIPVERRNVAPS